MTPTVEELWLEYRVAGQYPKMWGPTEESVRFTHLRSGQGAPPSMEDGYSAPLPQSGKYWMQQVDVPEWFEPVELGKGTGINVWQTMASLAATNKRRAKEYSAMMANLARQHKRKLAKAA